MLSRTVIIGFLIFRLFVCSALRLSIAGVEPLGLFRSFIPQVTPRSGPFIGGLLRNCIGADGSNGAIPPPINPPPGNIEPILFGGFGSGIQHFFGLLIKSNETADNSTASSSPPVSIFTGLLGFADQRQKEDRDRERLQRQQLKLRKRQEQQQERAAQRLQRRVSRQPGWPGSFQRWWQRQVEGRSGLLVFLLPTLLTQMQVLRTAAPFCAERLSQYLQPQSLLVSALLLQRWGPAALQWALWTGVALGTAFMVKDTFSAGPNWLPAQPEDDSYAVITGASSGLGRVMALQLYLQGYNLVLVARRDRELSDLRDALLALRTYADVKGHTAAMGLGAAAGTEGSAGADGARHSGYQHQETADETAEGPPACRHSHSIEDTWRYAAYGGIDPSHRQSHAAVALGFGSLIRWPGRKAGHRGDGFTDNDAGAETDSVGGASPFSSPLPAASSSSSSAAAGVPVRERDVQLVPCDLGSPLGAYRVARELRRRGILDQVDVLINNAGAASARPVLGESLSVLHSLVELNVQSAVALTRLLAPHIVRRAARRSMQLDLDTDCAASHSVPASVAAATAEIEPPASAVGPSESLQLPATAPGRSSNGGSSRDGSTNSNSNSRRSGGSRIMFVSSVAACAPGPTAAAYSASKAFLSSFGQALRRELLPLGVMVTTAHPGAVRGTDFLTRPLGGDIASASGGRGGGGVDRGSASGSIGRGWGVGLGQRTEHPSDSSTSTAAGGGYSAEGWGEGFEDDETLLRRGREGKLSTTGLDSSKANYPAEGTQLPLIYAVPGGAMDVQECAGLLLEALRTGRDSVVPGVANKLYVHVLSRWLPAPAVASLARAAWRPAPSWLRAWQLDQWPSSPISSGAGIAETKRSLVRRLREFWQRPVIDYAALRRRLLQPFGGLRSEAELEALMQREAGLTGGGRGGVGERRSLDEQQERELRRGEQQARRAEARRGQLQQQQQEEEEWQQQEEQWQQQQEEEEQWQQEKEEEDQGEQEFEQREQEGESMGEEGESM